jgi:polysaccharide biosynthesis transport protein
MDLKVYIHPLIRWWWLIAAATLVAAISSFLATSRQLPVYEAKTTLLVGRSIENPNPSQTDLYLAAQLAATYADYANREPVQNATEKALGLTWLPQYLARAVLNSQFIEIVVTDINPLRAQAVANELANQLILSSPTNNSEEQGRQDFINKQLNLLQSQILETQDEITKQKDQLGSLKSARQIADTQAQITALQTKLTTLQGNYAALLSNTKQGATNTLSVVVPAEIPVTPIGPNKTLSILLSSAIGLILAIGAAYLLEYLDDTIKTPEDVTRTLNLPVIGTIGYIKGKTSSDRLIIIDQPLSPVVEMFHALQINIQALSRNAPLKTILFSSTKPGEGKSLTIANLSMMIAQSGSRVIVIDADLRMPVLHHIFKLVNDSGLSDLLYDSNSNHVDELLQATEIDNLRVLTSGNLPHRPAEVLGSKNMRELLEVLKDKADLILIDTPPVLSVADTLTLGNQVDGVIFVVLEGSTRRNEARRAIEELRAVQINILGVVLRKKRGHQEGYSYYHYYSNKKSDNKHRSSEKNVETPGYTHTRRAYTRIRHIINRSKKDVV